MTPGAAKTRHLIGRPAAPGVAEGPLICHVAERERPAKDSRSRDWAAFRAAIDVAARGLLSLLVDLGPGEARDILEFQIEVLDDPALMQTVQGAVTAGGDAAEAWRLAIDAEIRQLQAGADDYFRARASDLEDLRDRVLEALGDEVRVPLAVPEGAIMVARDLPPSRFLEIRWGGGNGLALMEGSPTAHLAMLARSFGLPVVVGLGTFDATNGSIGLLDGEAGELLIDPTDADRSALAARRAQRPGAPGRDPAAAPGAGPLATAAGEPVDLLININGLTDLNGLAPEICDGIGLVRTEFLIGPQGDAGSMPAEDAQYEAYVRILRWAGGKRVVIRTLDAGGDKPVPGYTLEGEANPFLGLRGVRLSLARPEPFRRQVRALLRAAALGPLDVLVPMVSVPEEIEAVRAIMAEEMAAMRAAGIVHGRPRLGMMIEVPSAAMLLDRFCVDFASIGSNDLAQYIMAAGRDAADLGDLGDVGQPAVLALIGQVVATAARMGLPVGICGDAAGDPRLIPDLLGLGLRSFSVSPRAIPAARAAIAGTSRRAPA